jgi:hypothetical protein
VLGDKDGDNGEQVFCEFLLLASGVIWSACKILTENHEFDASFCKDPLDEFESKPAKSVLVEYHDLSDFSFVHAFQKGLETPMLPVESGTDVLDDFVELLVGMDGLFEVLDLSFEVGSLFFAADMGIEDFRFLGLELLTLFIAKQSVKVAGGIKSLAISMCSDDSNLSCVGPTSKGRPRDCIVLKHTRGRDIGGRRRRRSG